jgi:flagellar biogenesis protein FliO
MIKVTQTVTRLLNSLKVPLGFLEERYTKCRTKKRVRVRETVSFGEKRFLAVVEYQQHEMLIAGTASSISVLMTSRSNGEFPADEVRINKDCLQ